MGYDVENFYFLLITPAIFKETPGTRLYYYKMNEYQKDINILAADIPSLRSQYDKEDLRKKLEILSQHIGWLTWEDCYEVIRESGIEKVRMDRLTEFYRERLLVHM